MLSGGCAQCQRSLFGGWGCGHACTAAYTAAVTNVLRHGPLWPTGQRTPIAGTQQKAVDKYHGHNTSGFGLLTGKRNTRSLPSCYLYCLTRQQAGAFPVGTEHTLVYKKGNHTDNDKLQRSETDPPALALIVAGSTKTSTAPAHLHRRVWCPDQTVRQLFSPSKSGALGYIEH